MTPTMGIFTCGRGEAQGGGRGGSPDLTGQPFPYGAYMGKVAVSVGVGLQEQHPEGPAPGAGGGLRPPPEPRPAEAEYPISPIMSYAKCSDINDLAFVGYQDTALFTLSERKGPPEGGP